MSDEQLQAIKQALKEYLDEHADERKLLIKEALLEFLREQWHGWESGAGRWFLRAVMVAIFGALVYFVLWSQGWHK